MSTMTYPVKVDASPDSHLSRWLWLVKWLLAIPHYVVLALLWIAFGVLSVFAFFVILFTGRYPRPVFEFNVGVLRWTWRVQYYAYGALATDRYPPFTLAETPDYPAHLEIAYPERLSRGLVLVKWWLLALPHYLVLALFMGGGTWVVAQLGGDVRDGGGTGLITLLVLVAAFALAFTGRYPRPIYDFVLGMNRWVLRVAAYAAFMTDRYPPFRLDMGAHEPGGTITLPGPGTTPAEPAPPREPSGGSAPAPEETPAEPAGPTGHPAPPAGPEPPARSVSTGPWTPGRIIAVVIGAILFLTSLAPLAGGAMLTWTDRTQRDPAGYLVADLGRLSSPGYAVVSERLVLHLPGSGGAGWATGDVRVEATAADPDAPVFVGVADARDLARYLGGVSHSVLRGPGARTLLRDRAGGAPATLPESADIWAASTGGPGTQRLTWTPRAGEWVFVVMNADASPAVAADVTVAATAPVLGGVAVLLLTGGVVLAVAGVLLMVIPAVRAAR